MSSNSQNKESKSASAAVTKDNMDFIIPGAILGVTALAIGITAGVARGKQKTNRSLDTRSLPVITECETKYSSYNCSSTLKIKNDSAPIELKKFDIKINANLSCRCAVTAYTYITENEIRYVNINVNFIDTNGENLGNSTIYTIPSGEYEFLGMPNDVVWAEQNDTTYYEPSQNVLHLKQFAIQIPKEYRVLTVNKKSQLVFKLEPGLNRTICGNDDAKEATGCLLFEYNSNFTTPALIPNKYNFNIDNDDTLVFKYEAEEDKVNNFSNLECNGENKNLALFVKEALFYTTDKVIITYYT